ncbi:hypothetical protein ACTG9Q_19945 [Actinokineospora sp. 24-640]
MSPGRGEQSEAGDRTSDSRGHSEGPEGSVPAREPSAGQSDNRNGIAAQPADPLPTAASLLERLSKLASGESTPDIQESAPEPTVDKKREPGQRSDTAIASRPSPAMAEWLRRAGRPLPEDDLIEEPTPEPTAPEPSSPVSAEPDPRSTTRHQSYPRPGDHPAIQQAGQSSARPADYPGSRQAAEHVVARHPVEQVAMRQSGGYPGIRASGDHATARQSGEYAATGQAAAYPATRHADHSTARQPVDRPVAQQAVGHSSIQQPAGRPATRQADHANTRQPGEHPATRQAAENSITRQPADRPAAQQAAGRQPVDPSAPIIPTRPGSRRDRSSSGLADLLAEALAAFQSTQPAEATWEDQPEPRSPLNAALAARRPIDPAPRQEDGGRRRAPDDTEAVGGRRRAQGDPGYTRVGRGWRGPAEATPEEPEDWAPGRRAARRAREEVGPREWVADARAADPTDSPPSAWDEGGRHRSSGWAPADVDGA